MQQLALRAALLALAGLTSLALVAPGSAAAATVTTQTRLISPPSPFSASSPCALDNPGFTPGFAQETSVAVNPRNHRNVLAAWIQDGRATDTVMASRDGGRTFSRILVPGLSACTGGDFQVASDPGVEFAANGMAYFTAIVVNNPAVEEDAVTKLVVSRSFDGGFSWEPPRTVQQPTGQFWDLPRLTPDPRNAMRAYYAYDLRQPPDFLHGHSVLSVTNDGGRTWSAPRKLYDPQTPNSWPGISRILVNRDGSLVNMTTLVASDLEDEGSVTPPPAKQIATRSTDGGRTWGPAVTIGTSSGRVIYDPVQLVPLSTYNTYGSPAIAPDGDVYMAFNQIRANTSSSHIAVARSTDGGRHWRTHRFGVPGMAALPTIGIAGDGTVAVTYYAIDPASRDGFWSTRAKLATSRDHGRHWRRQNIAYPFNLLSAATKARGCCFLGDFEGIAPLRRGLLATMPVARPVARNGVDVALSRITTSR